jgi:hypothetical protein
MKQQAEKQKKNYTMKFDKSFFGKEINVYINNEQVIKTSKMTAEQAGEDMVSKTAKLMPGKHMLYINWDKHYDNIQIDPDSAKGIYLKILNDSLKHEFIF